ncbi:MAG: MBL fold metallo-hydrolase [Verrucomicrobiota bacterium]
MMRYLTSIFSICIMMLFCQCSNTLAPYRAEENLLVGVPAMDAPRPKGAEVSVTFLGVNSYLIRSASTTLLIDPYYSRVPLRKVVFHAPIAPSHEANAYAIRHGAIPNRVDGILITHSHFDHFLDGPYLQQRLRGKLITSRTGQFLAEASGVSRGHLLPSTHGDRYRIGEATIRVERSFHDKVMGSLPWPGLITEPLSEPPNDVRDWKLGTPLAYLIELHGKTIYIESGGTRDHLPHLGSVDLAILGTAVAPTRERYPEVVRNLSPRFVLPSHQDSLFAPIDAGFQFTPLANFPQIRAFHQSEELALPGRLILMDHFHTWMIPD